ncbi:MAG: hypothetical protein ACRC8S_08700 [Fimbriiglobus sp.]
MKNLLAFVGFVVVGFAGLGWYLGWYNLNVKTGADGKLNVSGDIDTKAITEDAKKFGQKVGKVIQNETDPGFVGPPSPADLKKPETKPASGISVTTPQGIQISVPGPK